MENQDTIRRRAENLRQRLDYILDAAVPDDVSLPPVSPKSEARVQAFSWQRKGGGKASD